VICQIDIVLIEAGSQIEAGSPIQARAKSNVLIEAGGFYQQFYGIIFLMWQSHLRAKTGNSKSPRHWLFHKLFKLFHFISC